MNFSSFEVWNLFNISVGDFDHGIDQAASHCDW